MKVLKTIGKIAKGADELSTILTGFEKTYDALDRFIGKNSEDMKTKRMEVEIHERKHEQAMNALTAIGQMLGK